MRNADHSYFLSPTAAKGKKLYIQEWNPDQTGEIVVFIHGFPGCSDQAKLMTSSHHHEAFRLIAIDRPGYGQSEVQIPITPVNFANQVVEILDHLQVDRVRLLSVSGGAPYSMAVAHKLGDRVIKMCSISGVSPLTRKNFRYLNPQQRKTFFLYTCTPHILQKTFLNRVWKTGLDKIDELLFTPAEDANGPDQTVFCHPDFSPVLSETLKKALSQGPDGILQDIKVYTKSWGFPTHEINCPITLWHGSKDDIVHVNYAKEMRALLNRVDLKIIENEGHYSLAMNFRDQILSDLLLDNHAL